MKKVKVDLDQVAAVMLLKGTPKQQEEALEYCGIKKTVVEDTGYASLAEYLINTPHQQVRGLTNSSCIKCGFLEKDMISVGPIPFCLRCFGDEFHTEFPITEEKETYHKWITKYKEVMEI